MSDAEGLVEELCEAQARLTDSLNRLIDEGLRGRRLTSREAMFVRHISKRILIAEGLVGYLMKVLKNE